MGIVNNNIQSSPYFKEIDLSSFEEANSIWFDIIKWDWILNGWLQLDDINSQFEEIHKSISNTPLAVKYPALTKLPIIGSIFNSNIWTKLVWFEWKLTNIFNAYDENYNALLNSSTLYSNHIKSLSNKIMKLKEHSDSILESEDTKVILYKNWIASLSSALEWTRTRMAMNLSTAEEIRIQMKMNRPIFKTIIDSLVIEKTWEIWLKAAQHSIDVMNSFIRKTSIEITDNTIAFGKSITKNKYSSVMSDTFKSNLLKLWVAMNELKMMEEKAVLTLQENNNINNNKILWAIKKSNG